MKKLLVIAALLCAACETSRYGVPCVGIIDKKRPDTDYALSTQNIVLGVVFSESIIVPAIVVAKELECPTRPPMLGGGK